MTKIKESDSIQIAKRLLDSKFHNFRWETMTRPESTIYLREIEYNLMMYYNIRDR